MKNTDGLHKFPVSGGTGSPCHDGYPTPEEEASHEFHKVGFIRPSFQTMAHRVASVIRSMSEVPLPPGPMICIMPQWGRGGLPLYRPADKTGAGRGPGS